MLEGILKAFSPAPPLSPPPWDAWIPLTVFLARGHPGSPVINSLSGISLSAPLPTPIAIRSLTVTKRHGQQKLCPLWTVTLASRFFSSLVSFGERVPTWFQYLFFFFSTFRIPLPIYWREWSPMKGAWFRGAEPLASLMFYLLFVPTPQSNPYFYLMSLQIFESSSHGS